jgi:hypothetical protein
MSSGVAVGASRSIALGPGSRHRIRADLLALGISAIGGYVGRGWLGVGEADSFLGDQTRSLLRSIIIRLEKKQVKKQRLGEYRSNR